MSSTVSLPVIIAQWRRNARDTVMVRIDQFNGTAVIEWNNVTPGHDLDIDWLQAHDYWNNGKEFVPRLAAILKAAAA